jgi:hypothetical protein
MRQLRGLGQRELAYGKFERTGEWKRSIDCRGLKIESRMEELRELKTERTEEV